jgi:hypothetical protein
MVQAWSNIVDNVTSAGEELPSEVQVFIDALSENRRGSFSDMIDDETVSWTWDDLVGLHRDANKKTAKRASQRLSDDITILIEEAEEKLGNLSVGLGTQVISLITLGKIEAVDKPIVFTNEEAIKRA